MLYFYSGFKYYFNLFISNESENESDIFKACKEGKLKSVQWLIEKENVDKNIRIEDYKNDMWKTDAPTHIASKFHPFQKTLIRNIRL